MKELFGMFVAFMGVALAYGGTFATFVYGIVVMVTDGFLEGLMISTAGAGVVFFIGILCAIFGAAIADD